VLLDAIYAVILFFVKTGLRFSYRVHIEGLENVPMKGPAVFLCNHTSMVDSFITGCFLPRKIFYMGKSTEFESAGHRLFFYLSRAFPVRRYDIDPISLRNAFRVLDFGGLVGIYPEGERTWDGRMLPLKIGTIRFLLAAGVPIVPAGISGAFQNQPRWGGKIGKPDIYLSIGRPIHAPKIQGKDQTKEDIDRLYDKIRSRISELARENSVV
jgi:1-acyl-sn-glycerol-3-phosphate acyltransferase